MLEYWLQFIGILGVDITPPDTFLAFFPWLLQWVGVFILIFAIFGFFKYVISQFIRGVNMR